MRKGEFGLFDVVLSGIDVVVLGLKEVGFAKISVGKSAAEKV